MTLVFDGHSFKYELEAVSKLFFPVVSFNIINRSDGKNISEISDAVGVIYITRRVKDGTAFLSVRSSLPSGEVCREDSLPLCTPDYEHQCELALCRLLFGCLRDQTGISPEWGMLTGVRPVKLVSRLRSSGMSDGEVVRYMADRLFVSGEKSRLALATARIQSDVMAAMPERSVSLYVSIPFCPSRCSYCSFVSQTVASFYKLIPDYLDKLCVEIGHIAETVRELGLTLDTVYFGGGTPTSLEAGQLERIMKCTASQFDLSKLREYTVEAGRPDTVTSEKLRVIRDNGGDRVSVNTQTLRDSVLDAIGRRHTAAQFLEAYNLAKKQGFKAVNVDLIAGLPTDDVEGFCYSLDNIIGLAPENITVHALSIKRAADLMHSCEQELNAAAASEMIAYSNRRLTESGYSPYYLYRQKNQLGNQENVGWERDGNVGVYNVNMMEEIQTVLAVGAGASTKLVVSENDIRRFYNPKYPLEYLKRFDETVITRKDAAKAVLVGMVRNGV